MKKNLKNIIIAFSLFAVIPISANSQYYALLREEPIASGIDDPTDISDLELWLDGNDADGDGDNDTGNDIDWNDKSGNNRHLNTSTGAKPDLLDANLNGLDVVDFDGAEYAESGTVDLIDIIGANTATIFIVQKQDGSQATNTTLMITSTPSNAIQRLNFHLSYNNVNYWDYGVIDDGGQVSQAQPSGWDDSWKLLRAVRSGSDGDIYESGTNILSGTFTDDAATNSSSTISVGATVTGTAPLKGQVAEIIIYSRVLTAQEISDVEDYLSTKWGL